MIPLPMKESIEKIIFELQKLIDQPTISNVNADEISRLKNIPTFIEMSTSECNRIVNKWEVVLKSTVLKNVDTSGRELVAYFLEEQFKLNNGHLVESRYILEHNTDLQNIALPLICRIFNNLPDFSRIKVNTILKTHVMILMTYMLRHSIFLRCILLQIRLAMTLMTKILFS